VPDPRGYGQWMTHTRSPRRLLVAVALAAVLPLASACGSSTPPPATGGSASSSASSAAPSTSATSDTATASGDDAAYCEALKTGQKELEGISTSITDQAALKQGLAVLQKIKDAAPDEVEQAWGDFIEFVESAAAGNTSAMASGMEKMNAAGTKIEAHAKSTCGLDIS
jgi:hypothetical protein